MIYEDFLSGFTSWRPENLYWQRFSIAERFGKNEIQSVYDDIMKESKKDYKRLTELVMVLNHKSFQHCEDVENKALCKFYTTLYKEANAYASDTLQGDELRYFLDVTD